MRLVGNIGRQPVHSNCVVAVTQGLLQLVVITAQVQPIACILRPSDGSNDADAYSMS